MYQINATNYDYYFDNPIILTANTTGTLTLRVNNTANRIVRFRGGVTGDNSLTIENWGSGDFAFTDKSGTPRSLDFSGTLTHIGDGTGSATINQVIGSNVTGVTQNSATSTLVLGSANTYTGPTTVSAGTLQLGASGSIANSSTIDVQSGATFDVTAVGGFTIGASQTLVGSGTVKGATTISGILAPGASPGILTFENALALAGSTVMDIDGNAGAGLTGGHDLINLTGLGLDGEFTYGGTLTLDIGTVFGAGSYSWDLCDFASETGTFSGIALADQYSGSLTDSGGGVWDLTSGNDTWTFTESTGILGLTVIPEPNVAALLAGLGAIVLLRRRS